MHRAQRSFRNCPMPPESLMPSQTPFHRKDYRSVIANALDARPFDEESVHDCVCTYVRAERNQGRSRSEVILALTDLVEQQGMATASARQALTRRVIPWCVDAYFGGYGR